MKCKISDNFHLPGEKYPKKIQSTENKITTDFFLFIFLVIPCLRQAGLCLCVLVAGKILAMKTQSHKISTKVFSLNSINKNQFTTQTLSDAQVLFPSELPVRWFHFLLSHELYFYHQSLPLLA